MDDFRKLIADHEAAYYPDIAAIHVYALICALHDLVVDGPPRDSKERLRYNGMLTALASISELHAGALQRWVSEHCDECHPED